MDDNRYRLYGALGSPYAAKMRALLRYRHIPFDWIGAGYDWAPDYVEVRPELRSVKPPVIPVLWFPHDKSHRTDSTVLAYLLEDLHQERRVVPPDPGHALISHLIEDMGDEWGMKLAFWYRWANDDDREFRSKYIMAELMGGGTSAKRIEDAARQFRDRQVHRMELVGVTPQNGPLVETTYARVLEITHRMNEEQPFIFGSRPALADFGLFGALFTCWNDPTPGGIMVRQAPGTVYWLHRTDEASGVYGEWPDPEAPPSRAIRELLELVGQVYLPFLAANAEALENGADRFSFSAFGQRYEQGVFRYQRKCLNWLRDEYAALSGDVRERTSRILEETGCLAYLR